MGKILFRFVLILNFIFIVDQENSTSIGIMVFLSLFLIFFSDLAHFIEGNF